MTLILLYNVADQALLLLGMETAAALPLSSLFVLALLIYFNSLFLRRNVLEPLANLREVSVIKTRYYNP